MFKNVGYFSICVAYVACFQTHKNYIYFIQVNMHLIVTFAEISLDRC